MAVKRRKLRGKQLLIVAGSLAGASFMGCGDDSRPTDAASDGSTDGTIDTSITDTAVANLIPPPDSALLDAPIDSTVDDGSMDATTTDGATDAASDGATDGSPVDAMPFDAPIANLIPPPDSGS